MIPQSPAPPARDRALASETCSFLFSFAQSASDVRTLPLGPRPEICLVGRSNVGKSSLLNRLAGQKQIARVSATPGRTRLLNLFDVRVPSVPRTGHTAGATTSRADYPREFGLVDLPGYGFALAPATERAGWQHLMRGYFEGRDNLRAFAFLVDVRRDPVVEDIALFRWLAGLNLIPLVVATKAEKVHKSSYGEIRRRLALRLGTAPEAVIVTSAQTGLGCDVLKLAVLGALRDDEGSNHDHLGPA